MEYIFNELKQFDLIEIKSKDMKSKHMKSKHYYIGLKNYSIIYFLHSDQNYNFGILKCHKFYEFANKTFDELTTITETFFNFCNTLKNTKQKIM